jgi:hypothetical protein
LPRCNLRGLGRLLAPRIAIPEAIANSQKALHRCNRGCIGAMPRREVTDMSEGCTPSRSNPSAIVENGDGVRDWTPRPWPTHGRPRGGVSRTIVERLAADIDAGRVRPGQKLPPQRLLALRLGVTPGSVARAYAEAERRGLVRGEVGRGTFVRPQERFESWCVGELESELAAPATGERYDLRLNHPPTGPEDELTQELETALRRALGKHAGGDLLGAPGRARDPQADAVLSGLRNPGRTLPLESTFLTSSATAGLTACLDQVARPGDTVLCERWTYPGLRALAASRSLKLIGVEQDAYGLIPEAVAQAVERYQPAAIYCGPNLQNPTGALMTLRRRVELAALVERVGVSGATTSRTSARAWRPVCAWASCRCPPSAGSSWKRASAAGRPGSRR